jgi:dopamine beta-monooxygenase
MLSNNIGVAFLALWCPLGVVAFPSLRERIPNGRRVPCPPGAYGCEDGAEIDCQPARVCNGVGHATCSGGSMPLNAFGQAFVDAGHKWTKALCEADSDGDGLTNGEELGDPCCLWQDGATPSDYTRMFTPTHPGVKNSEMDKLSYSRPSCDQTEPVQKVSSYNMFKDGEEQRSVSFRVNNYTIPEARTTYQWFAFNFPDDSDDLFHAVYARALLDKAKFLHHFIINGCSNKFDDALHGAPISSGAAAGCSIVVGSWARGAEIISVPTWVGLPIGKRAGLVALTLQIHYDNPDGEAGIVDTSGVDMYYTPTLRAETLSTFRATWLGANPLIVVPPGKQRWFVTRTCKVSVQDSAKKVAELNVLGVYYHAHTLGREMYAEVLKKGSDMWQDVSFEPKWHFDDQYTRNTEAWNLTFETGDILQTTCVMDSRGETKPMAFGRETTDEMCFAVFHGWPGNLDMHCEGEVWSGELSRGESPSAIGVTHPSSTAKFVWDGTIVGTGGFPIKMYGVDVDRGQWCKDVHPSCAGLVAQMPHCDVNLGFMNLAGPGVTVVGFCCQTACNSLCPEHERCSLSGPATLTPALPAGTSVESLPPRCAAGLPFRSVEVEGNQLEQEASVAPRAKLGSVLTLTVGVAWLVTDSEH